MRIGAEKWASELLLTLPNFPIKNISCLFQISIMRTWIWTMRKQLRICARFIICRVRWPSSCIRSQPYMSTISEELYLRSTSRLLSFFKDATLDWMHFVSPSVNLSSGSRKPRKQRVADSWNCRQCALLAYSYQSALTEVATCAPYF